MKKIKDLTIKVTYRDNISELLNQQGCIGAD